MTLFMSISFYLRNITQQLYSQPDQPVKEPKGHVIEDASGNPIGPVKKTIIMNAEGKPIDVEGQLPLGLFNQINYELFKAMEAQEGSMSQVEAGHYHIHTLQHVSVP